MRTRRMVYRGIHITLTAHFLSRLDERFGWTPNKTTFNRIKSSLDLVSFRKLPRQKSIYSKPVDGATFIYEKLSENSCVFITAKYTDLISGGKPCQRQTLKRAG